MIGASRLVEESADLLDAAEVVKACPGASSSMHVECQIFIDSDAEVARVI